MTSVARVSVVPSYDVRLRRIRRSSRAISRSVDVFAGVQNAFDTQYVVGTLPTTIGSPRFANVGVRIRIGGR